VVASVIATPRPTIDRIAAIALLGVASLRVSRLAPLWFAATTVLLSPTFVVWSRRVPERWKQLYAPSPAALRLTAIPILCAAAASAVAVARNGGCVRIDGDWIPDRVAGRALANAGARGTIVTWFDWGEYALWHVAPELRVSIDGRRETVYSDEVLANHDELYAGTAAGIDYLRRLAPTYIWLPASLQTLRAQLRSQGYRVDLETRESFVAARLDAPVIPFSRDEPPAGCFPGP
jgi:hypothetical protein